MTSETESDEGEEAGIGCTGCSVRTGQLAGRLQRLLCQERAADRYLGGTGCRARMGQLVIRFHRLQCQDRLAVR